MNKIVLVGNKLLLRDNKVVLECASPITCASMPEFLMVSSTGIELATCDVPWYWIYTGPVNGTFTLQKQYSPGPEVVWELIIPGAVNFTRYSDYYAYRPCEHVLSTRILDLYIKVTCIEGEFLCEIYTWFPDVDVFVDFFSDGFSSTLDIYRPSVCTEWVVHRDPALRDIAGKHGGVILSFPDLP